MKRESKTKTRRRRVILPEERERGIRRRMLFVAGILALCYLVALARSFQFQILDHERLLRVAEANYLKSIVFDTRRGDIVDRNGVTLAKSISVDTVYANPRRIKDKDQVAKLLSDALNLPFALVRSRLASRRYYTYIKRQVTSVEADRVRQLDITGVMIKQESKRFYPQRSVAAQLMGIVGLDSKGLEGIELQYNKLLLGEVQRVKMIRDSYNRTSLTEGSVSTKRLSGMTVVLSIDSKIQRFAEQELESAVLKARANSGMAVVMDVNSGEILAMTNYPTFNPNSYARFDRGWWRNRAIVDVYEPGSTFKAFVLAAALEKKVVSLSDIFDTEGGRMRVGRYIIHDTKPADRLSVLQCIKYSSNICMAKVAKRMGKKRLHSFLSELGFGKIPDVGFPGESPGMVLPVKKWGQIHLSNIAFGQGIAVSPLQLIRALAAIANGGELLRPILTKRIVDADGKLVKRLDRQQRKRVMSRETAARVKRAMTTVVELNEELKRVKFIHYRAAGKTGTSQKKNPDGPGYSEDLWIGSFIGFAPLVKPRIAVVVIIDEPLDTHYGGVVAGPAFQRITEWTLRYLGVPPSRTHESHVVKLETPRQPTSKPTALKVVDLQPMPLNRPIQLAAIMGRPLISVPDFTGLSMDSVRKLAIRLGLEVEYADHGLAARQSVPAQTRVPRGSRVRVIFALEGK